jgi:hypothetical protein
VLGGDLDLSDSFQQFLDEHASEKIEENPLEQLAYFHRAIEIREIEEAFHKFVHDVASKKPVAITMDIDYHLSDSSNSTSASSVSSSSISLSETQEISTMNWNHVRFYKAARDFHDGAFLTSSDDPDSSAMRSKAIELCETFFSRRSK